MTPQPFTFQISTNGGQAWRTVVQPAMPWTTPVQQTKNRNLVRRLAQRALLRAVFTS